MTAADRPRVGDQVTTAEQLDALPLGSVVRDHMGETHVSYLSASRGARFWQEVGVGDERSSYSMTREIGGTFTVLYVPGEPSRPSVTDDARAEGLAKERYPLREETNYHAGLYRGFLEGWAAGRAETTTAADEDTDLREQVAAVIREHLHGFGGPEHPDRIAADVMPLLATARTRPTETTTATAEDAVQALDARWTERWETEQPLADKYAGYYQGRVSANAQCREELRSLLASSSPARTRPGRDEIAQTIWGESLVSCSLCTGDTWEDACTPCRADNYRAADAVLALLSGGESR